MLTGVLITALSGIPARPPGIALDSAALFVIERGVAVIAVLIVGITLVGRTLKRELPIGFSATAGSVTYAQTVAAATVSSETVVDELTASIDKQYAELADQREELSALKEALAQMDMMARSGQTPYKPER